MPQLGSKSHSQIHSSQSKTFFSLGEEEKKALLPHTFSPEAPWAGVGPGASEPLTLFCHHTRGQLRTLPARRGQDLSIYIQSLECRREGKHFESHSSTSWGWRQVCNESHSKQLPTAPSYRGVEDCLLLPAPAFPVLGMVISSHTEILLPSPPRCLDCLGAPLMSLSSSQGLCICCAHSPA